MKKLLVALLLITMIFCFVGCDCYDDAYDEKVNELMDNAGFVVIDRLGKSGDTYFYLVYDTGTNVEYILVDGYCETSLCPRYNRNGDVIVHKGE